MTSCQKWSHHHERGGEDCPFCYIERQRPLWKWLDRIETEILVSRSDIMQSCGLIMLTCADSRVSQILGALLCAAGLGFSWWFRRLSRKTEDL